MVSLELQVVPDRPAGERETYHASVLGGDQVKHPFTQTQLLQEGLGIHPRWIRAPVLAAVATPYLQEIEGEIAVQP